MNQIDSAFSQLVSSRLTQRVFLINAEDYQRAHELECLGIHDDIIVVVGPLKRLHRWSGLGIHYPQAEIYRFFTQDETLSTEQALAIQASNLLQQDETLKLHTWIVLSEQSDMLLDVLSAMAVKKAKALSIRPCRRGKKRLSPYRKTEKKTLQASADAVTMCSQTQGLPPRLSVRSSAATPGTPEWCGLEKPHVPLTHVGAEIRQVIEKEAGGFPVTLGKVIKLLERNSTRLSQELSLELTRKRQQYKTATKAMYLIAVKNGLRVSGNQVVGTTDTAEMAL